MHTETLTSRVRRPRFLVALLLCAAAFGFAVGGTVEESGEEPVGWKNVQTLISEQKYKAALEAVEAIEAAARDAGDDAEITRALVESTKLRMGLHGYETAVEELMGAAWPEDPLSRARLELVSAHALATYVRAYAWEIGQREQVISADEVDLERWTSSQIVAAANAGYARLWRDRHAWGDAPLGELVDTVQPGNYPGRIRGTLRDAVSYLWVELLADSSLWSPRDDAAVDLMEVQDLLGDPGVDAGDEDLHPLTRLVAVLEDLESWHGESVRPEAALEARFERARRLAQAFDRIEDDRTIRADIERVVAAADERLEWWGMGKALIAGMLRQDPAADALIRAREVAQEGLEFHPDGFAGSACYHHVSAIEAPAYRLAAMSSDGPGKPSLRITHRNVERLYLRAYGFDLDEVVASAEDSNLLPGYREVPEFLEGAKPVAAWAVDLPATGDFRDHDTEVVPPLTEIGAYLVVASVREDFEEPGNRIVAVNLVVSDLVLTLQRVDGAWEVTARSGSTGEALDDVELELYEANWRRGHRRVALWRTPADGRARVHAKEGRTFLIGRAGDHRALVTSLWHHDAPDPETTTSALVYTDRSIYRPGHTIHWKVVGFRGESDEGRYETLPSTDVVVTLVDANGEIVAESQVTTNDFGSASGSFDVPAGRLLGSWTIRTSLGWSSQSIRVEEYKRPTFEVEIGDPEDALRLNREASLTGSARYYFGLPVTDGTVRWRVEREPQYPPWWGWWRPMPSTAPVVVAVGESSLDAQGNFVATFVPTADEREAADGVTYRFRLSADLTDASGETRSASRSFRLGFVTVEASIQGEHGFIDAREDAQFTIRRTDLDGVPRAGEGRWRLVRLEQPETARLPAEVPAPVDPEREPYLTDGDRTRARWLSDFDADRELASWDDGRELESGTVSHGDDGVASLSLDGLRPGAYRLHYETTDAFGEVFSTSHGLMVSDDRVLDLALAAVVRPQRASVPVGGTARILVGSGLDDQEMVFELWRGEERLRRDVLDSRRAAPVIEIPITADLRGGFAVRLTLMRDHQLVTQQASVMVPWDDRRLELAFSSFRDELTPGAKDTFAVTVRSADGGPVDREAAEVLAFMVDRSLDLFAPHRPVDPLGLYPSFLWAPGTQSTLGPASVVYQRDNGFGRVTPAQHLWGDSLRVLESYGIGGPGRRMRGFGAMKSGVALPMAARGDVAMEESVMAMDAAEPAAEALEGREDSEAPSAGENAGDAGDGTVPRSNFAETAFFEPHLLLDDDGEVRFSFQVPDSLTEWNLWVAAVTSDLRAGLAEERVRTVKDLMIRPAVPRFLREGDRFDLRVVVNNAGETPLDGTLRFEIIDPETETDLRPEFGVDSASADAMAFAVAPGGSQTLSIPLVVPPRPGLVAIRTVATAGDLSDGELRPLPVLPGRMHLMQSRFAALRDEDRRELHFENLAADDDPTLINEQLVVSVDAQLFYGVLSALPYLVEYPYECTEQTLNRFLSTAIAHSVFDRYPSVAAMAETMAAERHTRLEAWEADDPNRAMQLEETPWLQTSRGGGSDDLVKVLDPGVAEAQQRASLAKLAESQTSLGAFPWFPGGPPSPFMTLYVLSGFSHALEFGIEPPRDVVRRAWAYMHRHYMDEWVDELLARECCWEYTTWLAYVLSSYPDDSWTGGVFTDDDRRRMVEHGFRNWRRHSPRLKSMLALVLHREGRTDDAQLVWDSVMDSSETDRDLGTFWAPEERAWLWYNDTIESHAMALRTLTELAPEDDRRHGLVHWLFLNKKLNHWSSTRATAEVIYSLVHYLDHEGQLGAEENATVRMGDVEKTFVFSPDEFTGRDARVVVTGDDVTPAMATVEVSKTSPGLAFATATWHFSTERMPEAGDGDLFSVQRRFYRRSLVDGEWQLEPLAEGAALAVGDQVEVELRLNARHAAEYVHLRDPRGSGFEPEGLRSGWTWDAGLPAYEEIRDSGANFFIEWLPAGEVVFRHRLRATAAGTFRVAPSVIQSMYAPEFAAHSAGHVLEVAD
jgi:uncharacterized protein YfaS (alpha-2-macroglobulin family)